MLTRPFNKAQSSTRFEKGFKQKSSKWKILIPIHDTFSLGPRNFLDCWRRWLGRLWIPFWHKLFFSEQAACEWIMRHLHSPEASLKLFTREKLSGKSATLSISQKNFFLETLVLCLKITSIVTGCVSLRRLRLFCEWKKKWFWESPNLLLLLQQIIHSLSTHHFDSLLHLVIYSTASVFDSMSCFPNTRPNNIFYLCVLFFWDFVSN